MCAQWMCAQWMPYNVDTLQNEKSVLIIGVSALQGYSINANLKLVM